jgi:hypothetical protein
VVAFLNVVVAKVRREETILSVYLLRKLEPCQLVKEELLYQENKLLKEEQEKVRNLTTLGLN